MEEKLTFSEIKVLLQKYFEEYDGDGDDSISNLAYASLSDFPSEGHELYPKLGKVEIPFKYGGEGQGERWEKVFYFPQHDVYAQLTGFYTSYDGAMFYGEWVCLTEVKPATKSIIVYQ